MSISAKRRHASSRAWMVLFKKGKLCGYVVHPVKGLNAATFRRASCQDAMICGQSTAAGYLVIAHGSEQSSRRGLHALARTWRSAKLEGCGQAGNCGRILQHIKGAGPGHHLQRDLLRYARCRLLRTAVSSQGTPSISASTLQTLSGRASR